MRRRGFCGLAIILASLTFFCTPLPSQTPVPLPELNFKRTMSDLQIIVGSSSNLGENMAIGLGLRYGASLDLETKSGLASLITRMFVRATLDNVHGNFRDELNYLGSTIEIRCDWDGIRFILRGPSSNYEGALLLLYQIVCEVQFNEADLAAAKQDILAQIQKPADSRQQILAQFDKVLFNGTTYARALEGTARSLAGITLGDIRFTCNKFFSPGSATLIVIGKVPADDVIQKASRIWGIWVRKDDVPFLVEPPRRPAGRNIYLDDDPESLSAQFVMGTLWPRREDPVYLSAKLAARILQDRLTKLLPTSLITVSEDGRRMTGPFYIQGQAAADQAVEQIQKIEQACDEMKNSFVPQDEVQAAQKALIEEYVRQAGTPDGLCNIMLDADLYRLGTNYAAVFPDLVRRCNAESVRQVARNWLFPSSEVILLRGPASVLKPALTPLGIPQKLEKQ
jgi:zinc protease